MATQSLPESIAVLIDRTQKVLDAATVIASQKIEFSVDAAALSEKADIATNKAAEAVAAQTSAALSAGAAQVARTNALSSAQLAAAKAVEAETARAAAVAAKDAVLGSSGGAPSASAVAKSFQTYKRPFSAQSLWNSRPVSPVLSSYEIPATQYFPIVDRGSFSTGVFEAKNTDSPVTVTGASGALAQPDIAGGGDVTIPRFPANVIPATGTDGHADIIDVQAGIVHSFFQLQKVGTQWQASVYAWAPLDGTGWGDPAHYYTGARATGVSTTAGLIRTHEVDDGDVMYRHALAMSLDSSGLSGATPYVFPATSADSDAATAHVGGIPEGTLMMLPASFDVYSISDLGIRKVAQTLKTYGARVVDRNTGTRFVIYSEIGSSFGVNDSGAFSSEKNDQMVLIADALRPVSSAAGWVDGDGASFVPNQKLNLLSMRGPYNLNLGPTLGVYNTFKQRVEFAATSSQISQNNGNATGISNVSWAKLTPGASYTVTAICTGGGKLKLTFVGSSGGSITTGDLTDGQKYTFNLMADYNPAAGSYVNVEASNGANGQASTVSGTLVQNGDVLAAGVASVIRKRVEDTTGFRLLMQTAAGKSARVIRNLDSTNSFQVAFVSKNNSDRNIPGSGWNTVGPNQEWTDATGNQVYVRLPSATTAVLIETETYQQAA
jgi:hypothetical protein